MGNLQQGSPGLGHNGAPNFDFDCSPYEMLGSAALPALPFHQSGVGYCGPLDGSSGGPKSEGLPTDSFGSASAVNALASSALSVSATVSYI